MTRRPELRRPQGRGGWDPRSPSPRRPTVHPNPAGTNRKAWAGVMCVPKQAREEK
ncbi:hypothetical protein [Nocardia bovistercoris]|uniref:Uncharacterized protein n=1 Tax=Nocardia bovistercoris TaxID=2785916 RepID=A0A931I8R6_9NOCA|nr:hypothetical protein [Nocardia bovistercoris]MBH0775817.1 hypothetical protein [Nocardia bovistercoris]